MNLYLSVNQNNKDKSFIAKVTLNNGMRKQFMNADEYVMSSDTSNILFYSVVFKSFFKNRNMERIRMYSHKNLLILEVWKKL